MRLEYYSRKSTALQGLFVYFTPDFFVLFRALAPVQRLSLRFHSTLPFSQRTPRGMQRPAEQRPSPQRQWGRPAFSRVQRKGMKQMYAIIVTGGKQYRVEQGDIVYIEKLDVEADSEVKFDQVLAIGEEGSVKVGAPVVEGASVSAKVIKNGKGKKLNIITYRAKKHSARRMGHRQPFTKVEITAING